MKDGFGRGKERNECGKTTAKSVIQGVLFVPLPTIYHVSPGGSRFLSHILSSFFIFFLSLTSFHLFPAFYFSFLPLSAEDKRKRMKRNKSGGIERKDYVIEE